MVLAVKRDAFVVFGHCPKQCPMLKKMPEYYG
jgi:hypothetical protein